jgi:hypothetical protein
MGLIASHRAEHAQAVRTAPSGKLEDLIPPFRTQCVQSDHVSIVRQKEFREPIPPTGLVWTYFGFNAATITLVAEVGSS